MGDKDNNNMTGGKYFQCIFCQFWERSGKIIPAARNSQYDYSFSERNLNSMFLSPVEESEIIQNVSKCKNKTSNYNNNIDLTVVKRVIEAISKPLTYIYNLSFYSGKCASQMKIAKVIPLYKSNVNLQTTDCFPCYHSKF